jgi:hypothetical protein
MPLAIRDLIGTPVKEMNLDPQGPPGEYSVAVLRQLIRHKEIIDRQIARQTHLKRNAETAFEEQDEEYEVPETQIQPSLNAPSSPTVAPTTPIATAPPPCSTLLCITEGCELFRDVKVGRFFKKECSKCVGKEGVVDGARVRRTHQKIKANSMILAEVQANKKMLIERKKAKSTKKELSDEAKARIRAIYDAQGVDLDDTMA